jgi:hypothetical protein
MLSCLVVQSLDIIVSRGSDSVGAYLILKAPGCCSREPEYVLSRGDEAGWLTGGEILSAHDYRGGVSAGVDYA